MDYVAVKVPGLSVGDWVIVRGNERMRGPGPVIASLRKDATIFEMLPPNGDRRSPAARTATTIQGKPPVTRAPPTSQPSVEG